MKMKHENGKLKILSLLIFISLAFPAFSEMKYIEIGKIQNATIVEVKSLPDFETLISKNNISTAFLQTSSSDLLINIGNTYFSFPLKGYSSISDYKTGESLGFKNGTDYAEAKSLTLSDSSEVYSFYKRNEFKSIADCRDAYKNGFCFVREKEEKTTETKFTDSINKNNAIESISYQMSTRMIAQATSKSKNSESESYYKAKELGYKKYSEYKEYLDFTAKGFKSKKDMENATAKGFSNSREFYEAEEQGFSNCADYKKAHSLGFSTNDEFKIYNATVSDLEKIIKAKAISKKYAVIYYYIQKLPKEESSLSVLSKSLKNLFDATDATTVKSVNLYVNEKNNDENSVAPKNNTRQRNQYQQSFTPRLDASTFFTEESLRDFFAKVDCKELGSYSSQSEIFKKK